MVTVDVSGPTLAYPWLVAVVCVLLVLYVVVSMLVGRFDYRVLLGGVLVNVLVFSACYALAEGDRAEYLSKRFEVGLAVTLDEDTLADLDRLKPGDDAVVVVGIDARDRKAPLLVKPDSDSYGEVLYVKRLVLGKQEIEVLETTPFMGELIRPTPGPGLNIP